jgi:hypothetical protein
LTRRPSGVRSVVAAAIQSTGFPRDSSSRPSSSIGAPVAVVME